MSGVKIKAAAGGGSTELQGPASTADNTVLKLPSNIVADQFLTTDSNGAMSWAEAGGGKILQLQYATTTTGQKTHTADIWEARTPTVSITPSSTTSKILIQHYAHGIVYYCNHAELKLSRKVGTGSYTDLTGLSGYGNAYDWTSINWSYTFVDDSWYGGSGAIEELTYQTSQWTDQNPTYAHYNYGGQGAASQSNKAIMIAMEIGA